MIYVGGVPFATDDSSQDIHTLISLMEHPVLASASSSFKNLPESKFSISEPAGSERSPKSKWVYVFQREFAIIDPALVDFVGTDEATTCVGLVIRNPKNGMTSVAHLDSPNVVDMGLNQMLSLVADHESDTILDVHLIGGFDDTTSQVETSTGSIMPASFDRASRCPDEVVRRIRVTACFDDPNWGGRLLETYDTKTDRFVIAPCIWSTQQLYIAVMMQGLSDTEMLHRCSTSPAVEAPDFVENLRRQCNYLIHHPLWRETFPHKQARVFQRGEDGNWVKLNLA